MLYDDLPTNTLTNVTETITGTNDLQIKSEFK